MATKKDLESRAADCKSVDDFVTLAQEALADPANKAYAKTLLQKAELNCQMPLDYIRTAEIAAGSLEDMDYAGELYDQAEDMLFEVAEFTAFAHGMAVYMDKKDKALEYLQKAAEKASQLKEFLMIANQAKQDLDDEELAKSLLAKVEEKAKGLDDYRDLAQSILEAGDSESARGFFKKAARFCDDIPATINYAREIINLFDDKDWAQRTLDEAETDCQFTKQFVELAHGYKDLFEDGEKVNELMDQAAEFCMTGEEQIDLAEGYWSLLGDKDKAAESYQKALSEITDKQALLKLASKVATELNNNALAKTIYAKAESRMSSASELGKLAQAVVADLGDREYAAQVYERATQNLSNPNDLANLAGELISQLGNKEQAIGVYRKAYERAGDVKQLLNLASQVDDNLADKNFAREILEKAVSAAQESPILVEIANKILSVLEDKTMAARVIESAEERITSLGELKTVTQTIKTHFSDDTDWISRVDEKLAKREANQAKYNVFQQLENKAENLIEHLRLAERVMEELEDKFYARKLLASAEQVYRQQGYDFNQGQSLILAINNHLDDQKWIKQLLDDAAERCANFACLHAVGETASVHLTDTKAGTSLAKGYYQAWEKGLDENRDKDAYDYTKLAKVVDNELGDHTWALALVDKAAQRGGDHFAFAEMGAIANHAGNSDKAKQLYQQAAAACANPEQLQQLVKRMKAAEVDSNYIRELYAQSQSMLKTPLQRLHWAEGIIQLFQDKNWARQEYDKLSSEFSSGVDALQFKASQQSRLRTGLW
jgi:tetratricopeptide (TPR) repeat protein